jgi:MazG family protein
MSEDNETMQPARNIERLLEIMAALRNPETGCPWDKDQTFATIAPYTIEEAYEVAEAIQHDDMAGLTDELGDLLLQVVYHARIAEEAGHFQFGDVVFAITDKMIRRHPHVFGSAEARAAGAAKGMWERIKADEREAARKDEQPSSALDGVPFALPALTRAVKLQKKAARVGFDWPESRPVIAKVLEELDEIEQALGDGADKEKVAEEIGDLLFAAANLARHLHIDPEQALRAGNAKFERRFHEMEARLALRGVETAAASLDEMEDEWQAVKASENT